jgi:two-component sensor histidine kinase
VGRVHYVLYTEPVKLTVDYAIPCGLIANELLSNALKHAFPGGREGTVTVQLKQLKEGNVQMAISDNGQGLPNEFDTKRGNTLGLQLVRTLTEQVGGQIEILRQPHTAFTITFPLPAELRNRIV